MRYFGTFDASGFPTGFYEAGLSPSIPESAVSLTEAQWFELVQYPGQRTYLAGQILPAPALSPIASPLVRSVVGSALREALRRTGQSAAWVVALATQSQDTRDWWIAMYDEAIRVDAKELTLIASACVPPVDLDKLFTAASASP